MAHPLGQLAIIAGVFACVGCDHPPTAPDPGGSTNGSPTSSNVYTTPPIRGLIRETNGGPIAGVMVGLRTIVGTFVKGPQVASDATGVFVVPSSPDLCPQGGRVALEIFNRDFLFQDLPSLACTSVSNPQEILLEVKGQRVVTAVSGTPVEFTVSNDDLNWLTDENGYSCGPCRIVLLKLPPQDPTPIVVEWSGPDPIQVWVEGDRGYGDLVRLREAVRPPGETQIRVFTAPEWRDLDLVVLKIGLPYGGRFPAGSSGVAVRIEVRG